MASLQKKEQLLRDDLGESKNIASSHPEKVAELQKMMDAFMKELAENSRPIGKVEGFVPPEKKKRK